MAGVLQSGVVYSGAISEAASTLGPEAGTVGPAAAKPSPDPPTRHHDSGAHPHARRPESLRHPSSSSSMASPGEADVSAGASRDDGQSDGQPAKKRRAAPSSRGVANLTPEQLARKRANDREAQRAIRERTRSSIDKLNQRIRDLESQQPYHDLQVVLREKEAVQAENADIRKRLESVLSILQPIVRPPGGLNGMLAGEHNEHELIQGRAGSRR